MVECDREILSFSGKFGMFMSGWDIYFLEVSAHFSMKVAIESCFRGEKLQKLQNFEAIFLKQEWKSVT